MLLGLAMGTILAFLCFTGLLLAADFPEASISNGQVNATLRLPDAERGYYQGTRFDWSGVISSLQYQGHEYFGQWFEKYDPKIHDAITGPVEEFLTDGAGPGYAEAKPGGTFIRIGVGVVRKPDEAPYQRFHTYEIVDHGKWTVHRAADHVEFVQRLEGPGGYAYEYRKLVRLSRGKPQLVLEHALRNTGEKPIETAVYDHNFFVIDGQPTGPEATVKFAFEPRPARELKPMADVQGQSLVYARELQKGESVFSELQGFGETAKDYDIHIENRKAGAGVRITGDRPLAKVVFWSIRTTLCPEPYIQMRIEPGKESRWKISYDFYTLGP